MLSKRPHPHPHPHPTLHPQSLHHRHRHPPFHSHSHLHPRPHPHAPAPTRWLFQLITLALGCVGWLLQRAGGPVAAAVDRVGNRAAAGEPQRADRGARRAAGGPARRIPRRDRHGTFVRYGNVDIIFGCRFSFPSSVSRSVGHTPRNVFLFFPPHAYDWWWIVIGCDDQVTSTSSGHFGTHARCDDAKLVAETPAAVIRMWRSDYDNATAYNHSEHRHGLYGNFDITFGPSIPL